MACMNVYFETLNYQDGARTARQKHVRQLIPISTKFKQGNCIENCYEF